MFRLHLNPTKPYVSLRKARLFWCLDWAQGAGVSVGASSMHVSLEVYEGLCRCS